MRLKLSRQLVNEYAYPILAPLVALLLLFVALELGLFERLENITINWRFQVREPYDPKSDPRVILVKIDQTSLDNIGRWPWDRSVHGDFSQLTAAANVSVLGFDLLFTEPQDKPKEANPAKGGKADKSAPPEKSSDAYFAESAGQVHVVVTGANFDPKDKGSPSPKNPYNFGKTKPFTQIQGDLLNIPGQNVAVLPIEGLLNNSSFGFVEVAPGGSDGIRRTLPMLERVGNDVFPTLSLQMLCQFWNIPPEKVRIRLGSEIELPIADKIKRIPIDEHGEMLLNYRAGDSSNAINAGVNTVSYGKLLGGLSDHFAAGKDLDKSLPDLNNKILLVGQTAVGLIDFGPSPLEAYSPLVAVHLTALNNILMDDYLKICPTWPIALGWLILSWATLFYLRKRSILFSIVVPLFCAVVYLILAEELFINSSLLIPMVWPTFFFLLLHFGIIVLRWLEEQQSRQQIKGVFSRMLSPEIMEHLLENPGNIKMGGSERPVTILFSDIRDYTKFSEGLKPSEVVRQLNIYFERMVGCVNDCGGTLHKYIGDAIMAAWGDIAGASQGPEKDAQNAVRSALMMRRLLRELNVEREAEGLTPLRIGMGLNHGPDVLVGLIGASKRSEFTVMGDAVNTASRLEGVTKEYKTDLAIGESVYALVKGKFMVRTLGVIGVKGRSKPVKVYEVLDDLEKPVGLWPADWVAEYEKAMASYFAREFRAARGGFKKCLQKRPEDFCSKRYLDLCDELMADPPPKDWDGTQVMKTK
jgi:adenylate cyclase